MDFWLDFSELDLLKLSEHTSENSTMSNSITKHTGLDFLKNQTHNIDYVSAIQPLKKIFLIF